MEVSGKCFIASVRETLHTNISCASVWYECDGIVSTENCEFTITGSHGCQQIPHDFADDDLTSVHKHPISRERITVSISEAHNAL